MGECYTDISRYHAEFKWTISELQSHLHLCETCTDAGANLKSLGFNIHTNNDISTWYLELYFKGSSGACRNWISLGLTFESSMRSSFFGYYKIYRMCDEERKMEICRSTKLITFEDTKPHLITEFLRRESVIGDPTSTRPLDSLTIICELVLISDPFTVPGPPPIKIPAYELYEDYQELYDKRDCSDVKFIVSGTDVAAHKAILMARSRVFAAMFRHDMVENKRNRVEITDMSLEVFNELLRFIYTNKVHNINKLADSLLSVADKYEIKILKAICEQSLLRTINIDNAAQILMLADNHNCQQLITHTILFINRYGRFVLETRGFKTMEKSHPHLITSMYKALFINRTARSNKRG